MASRGLSVEMGALVDKKVQASDGAQTLQDCVQALADSAGMQVNEVSSYLSGDSTCPPMAALQAWGKTLSVDPKMLVDAAQKDGCSYDEAAKAKPAQDQKPMDTEEEQARSAKLIRAIAPRGMERHADRLICERSTVDEARQFFLRELQKTMAPCGSFDQQISRSRVADIDEKTFLRALVG